MYYSYEQDTELFNFDYKDDLLMMARERERIFALQKFSTQEEAENAETQQDNQ